MQGTVIPGTLALLLHAALAGVMLQNWSQPPTIKKVKTPKFVQAKLVSLKEKPAAPKPVKKKPKPKFEKPPVAKKKPAPKKPVVKIPKKVVEKPKPKPKPVVKDVEPAKPDPEILRKARKKAEDIRRQQALLAAMQEEEVFAQNAEDAQATQSYIGLITRVIQNNWNRPLSARNGMEAELLIQLVPNGQIVGVTIVRSSGDAAFDRSAELAVKKVGSFPELGDMPAATFERNFRRLRFLFKPEDLRS